MKKHYYLLIIAVLALASFVPVAVRAESGSSSNSSSDDSSEIETEVEIEIEHEEDESDDDSTSKPASIREKLRIKTENGEIREDVRNKLINGRIATSTRIEIRTMASTTRGEHVEIRTERREDAGEIREEMRERIRSASSSDDRRDIRTDMRKDIFEVRKQALIKQLEVSINNLKQIRDRIVSRIEKAEDAGKNMSEARELLITADAKIVAAEIAVDGIVVFAPTDYLAAAADSSSVTASTTIDLTKPREMAETAIKAIKEAHQALVDVVRSVAHSLGSTKNATTTPPVTGTTSASTNI
ncbi:MAG: hypothetical protein KBC33_03835 [Candidatus Pacebacteria bacterium]|nr:hypothetical protein [Candidatus Paceibacterota bacterium]